jgi:type II secretion system protein J
MMRARQSSFTLHRRSGAAGFTLLELLIATAVGAIVLIVIQTTYFGALRLHNTTHARLDEDSALHRAVTIIRRDLGGVMLPGGTFSGQFQTENFSTPNSASYGERVTPDLFTNSGRIDPYSPFSDVQMVAYYLAAPEGGQTSPEKGNNLVRVLTRNLLPVQEPTAEEQVVLEGVAAATMSYFDGMGWIDTWDSTATSTLPRALKLSLTMAPHGASQTTPAPVDIVVPVAVMTTTSQQDDAEAANP